VSGAEGGGQLCGGGAGSRTVNVGRVVRTATYARPAGLTGPNARVHVQ
jgi:hypothetical protein